MRSMKSLLVAGVAAVAATAAWSPNAFSASTSQDAQLTTPLGITLQELGAAARYEGAGAGTELPGEAKPTTPQAEATGPKPLPFFAGGGPRRGGAQGFTYADASGKSLYTYDKDTEKGKSACYDECIKNWPAAVAPKGAKAFGNWSIIKRTDGTMQWAFKDKPLYSFLKDTKPGDKKGDGAGNAWRNAKFDPAAGIELPYGMGVDEADAANGYVLVDSRRMTMYTFDGNASKNKLPCATSTCPDHWLPVSAAMLANPKGDFSLITRDDGVKQWAFKGKPLYTYGGDYIPGDANGTGLDKKYQVALLAKHFIPKQAGIRQDIARGPVVTTADGMTLYRRDTSYHQPDGHGLPGSTPGNPSVGRAMGVKSCRDDCLKTWHPFAAPADAEASGFWDIVARPDGTRQWAYKGFALYTYVNDKKPGDKTGNDIYDILVTDDLKKDVLESGIVNTTDSATLFWSYVEH